MKNIEDLDHMLKSGMDNFHPTPPDVWTHIAQQIQTTPSLVEVPGKSMWQSVQQASLLVKSGIFMTVTVMLSALVVLYYSQKEHVANLTSPSTTLPELARGETPTQDTPTAIKEPISALVKLSDKWNNKTSSVNKELSQLHAEPSIEMPEAILESPVNKIGNSGQLPPSNHLPPVTKIPLTENFDGEEKSDEPESTPHFDKPHFGNVFSPDGDGKNDKWEIIMEEPTYYHLRIFDRGGKLVFESEELATQWAGTLLKTGQACEGGTYAFQLEYQYTNQNKVQIIRGMVTLIR